MKISYRRDSGISYMVLEGSAISEDSSFFMKMTASNKVAHLLPLKSEKINAQTVFLYDITGKRSLEKTFETRKMSYDSFVSFIVSLRALADDLSELLLDADRIILRTDAVFMDHSGNDFWFCADPSPVPDPRPFIKDFFNRIPALIDYDDPRLVSLVFGLSRLTGNDVFSLQDILSADISSGRDMPPDRISEPDANDIFESVPQSYDEIHPSFIEKARLYFKGKSASEIYDAINSGRIFRLIKETNVPASPIIRREDPLPAPKEDTISDTAPLNISELPFHRLNGLDSADGIIILLDHFPFTIGKEDDSADFRLNLPQVSRLHCRIHENEDGSFDIEDLNSRNGSLVNNIPLDPYSRIPLLPGDTVSLADMKFVFL